ncbi:MAG: hypothetical protein A2068_11060 [Ignavibacteria bacterium GWB2_35_6b]|nr:MAG: hypothetical protein A2068_11060 [Ignavibacteria bacterium GWB2_35_6b]
MPRNNHQKELKSIVSQINKSWLNNDLKQLDNFFHENMIIADSNFNKLAKNKKECIASYESFIKQAKILKYEEQEINIDIIGNTAIVNYIFDITWEVNKNISSEKGRDVFVFECSNNKWLAVWRTLLPIL